MIQTIKNLYLKLLKKPVEEEPEEEEEEEQNITAYFNIALNDKNELLFDGNFLAGHEKDMSRLAFMLCSGSMLEFVSEIIKERCENDDQAAIIVKEMHDMYIQYVNTVANSDDEDDDDPVVDPCQVFKNKSHEEE